MELQNTRGDENWPLLTGLSMILLKDSDADAKRIPFKNPRTVKVIKGKLMREKMVRFLYNKKYHTAILRWKGFVDQVFCVGCEISYETEYGTNGTFAGTNLFKSPDQRSVLIPMNILENSCLLGEHKKLNVVQEVIDVSCICCIKQIKKRSEKSKCQIYNRIKTIGGKTYGMCKWFGLVNGIEVVGVELTNQIEKGTNGTFYNTRLFISDLKYGALIESSLLQIDNDADNLHYLVEGIIDPNTPLICEEKWEVQFLEERNIKKNDIVSVIIRGPNIQRKMKGVFMWCGFMNKMPVGVVELDKNYEHGTDGKFGKDQLFKCDEKRVIGTSWDNIFKYLPFKRREIPDKDRIFPEIDINSAVKYYYALDNDVKDLYGTVRWTGVNEDDEYLYGIELEDRLPQGTDGEFKHQRLFNCQNGRGILAELNCVIKDSRFTVSKVDPKDVPMSKNSTKICSSRLTKLTDGVKKGIQGNAHSCFLDSSIFALFATTDVLDYLIHPITNELTTDNTTKLFRDVLSKKIIFPLRQFGFVSFHKTQEMREIVQNYGPEFAEITKQETDMEDVSDLLTKLCPNDQFLKIISNNNMNTNSMYLQLILTLDMKVKFMSIEEMLKVSMVQSDIMFHELPTCLIMQAPRNAREINCYDYVLPSDTIEISEICYNHFRKCIKCYAEASQYCIKCFKTYNLDIPAGFKCSLHSCNHKEVDDIPKSHIKSKSKVFMKLQAIICIEKCHFVAYVKQNANAKENSWFRFDSLNKYIDNYPVPSVSFSKNVSHFLNSSKEEMKNLMDNFGDEELKRIVKDFHIFIYHNETKTCY